MKVLFLCTHNRCRSILGEAITNQTAGDTIQAASAGSSPAGVVHPLTLKYLQQAGYSTDRLESQSWDDFQDWNPDVVITLCDSAAGETCPVWMQTATRIHWGLSDPSKLETEQEQSQAFQAVIKTLESRVKRLSQMDLSVIDRPLIDTIAAMGQETN